MTNWKALLWDIDGTLLNFLEAEKRALRTCFAKFSLGECTDEMLARYSAINRRHWEALERGELTKPEVQVGRYREFFAGEGIDTRLAEAFDAEYQIRLGDTCVFCEDGYELVKELRGKVKQYAVTNGTTAAQERRLKNSGLDELFDGVFISDKIGYEKPSREFFDAVFAELDDTFGQDGYRKDEILIIGDSLTSDIRGGNNAGIRTCWYNPAHRKNDQGVSVDFEIESLREITRLVQET
jgi:2-haloacid dehalogenase